MCLRVRACVCVRVRACVSEKIATRDKTWVVIHIWWLSGVGGRYIYRNFVLTISIRPEQGKIPLSQIFPIHWAITSLFMLTRNRVKRLHHFLPKQIACRRNPFDRTFIWDMKGDCYLSTITENKKQRSVTFLMFQLPRLSHITWPFRICYSSAALLFHYKRYHSDVMNNSFREKKNMYRLFFWQH